MQTTTVTLGGYTLPAHIYDAVVVGTGCAGFNAADWLYHYGRRDIAIVTDHQKSGTSRNTGSDKQTYYKISLSGDEPDSVRMMAETYFAGQCMDGEHALCEAALSAKCFLRLCDLGVPFPVNRYGEYVGYKTDHDPRRRATSVGPLTSNKMTEALEKTVLEKGIPILDHHQVVAILTGKEGRVTGLLCLNTDDMSFELVLAGYIIYATGGPAGIYQDSCYPLGHYGMSGAAFEAGAAGKNVTEWQYGLASVSPRWNVSGTYMQVLPRFISTDQAGKDEHEFLPDYLSDPGQLLSHVFLKGYQWPFDTRKALDGSSIIDLIVYTETKVKGRRVFLDFRENPLGEQFSFDCLAPEAYEYLQKAGALMGKPIDRLRHMNAPAIDFYRSRGVDLETEMLEIALCSQHNNGGIAIDAWWQTTVPGLFAAGEVAASHGVYRPGGSALNAGQVGSQRAAQFISKQPIIKVDAQKAADEAAERLLPLIRLKDGLMGDRSNLLEEYRQSIAAMSKSGAAVRSSEAIRQLYAQVQKKLASFAQDVTIAKESELPLLYRYRDILITQAMYLCAMMDYATHGGKSRGSGLYTDPQGQKALSCLPESCRLTVDDGTLASQVQEVCWNGGNVQCCWRPVHPIPEVDDFFENVWRDYRKNENVY